MGRADVTSRVEKVKRAAKRVVATLPEADRGVFLDFVQAVAAELRAPYIARFSLSRIPEMLLEMFELAKVRAPDQIQTQVIAREAGGCVVRSNMADQPFIYDTVRLQVDLMSGGIDAGFNVVLHMGRDADGRLVRVGHDDDPLESMVEVILSSDVDCDALQRRLHGHLRLARAMVQDFSAITGAVSVLSEQYGQLALSTPDQGDAYREAAEFLRWLLADNFVFMGAVGPGRRLGFDHESVKDVWESTPVDDTDFGELPVVVRKGVREAPVHRAGRVDDIRIRVPNAAGGQDTLLVRGMFTFRAVTQPSRSVPILRRVLGTLLQQDTARPGSWRYKGIANVFDSLPTEYLFTAGLAELREMIDRVLDAEAARGSRVYWVQKPGSDVTFVLAAMPRAQYTDSVREQMEALLRSVTGATYSDDGVLVGRYDTVLVHFYLTGARRLEGAEAQQLDEELIRLATPWDVRLYDVMVEVLGEEPADALFGRYSDAFERRYQVRSTARRAKRDIQHLEQLGPDRPVCATVFEARGELFLRVYQIGNIILSEALPVLENLGLVVIDQFADQVTPKGSETRTMDTYRLQGAWGLDKSELVARREVLEHAIEAIFQGKVTHDGLSKLTLRAGLSWQDVDLIRAYQGHLQQLGLRIKGPRVTGVLLRHPKVVSRLRDYFHARFSPELGASARRKHMKTAEDAVLEGLRGVTDGNEDYVLRSFFQLMQGTLRTNFFRADRKAWYISYKVDHAACDVIPAPKLKYEIYVHHPAMEGIHFRGGDVARGGLRWSDRTDYRTEIMGLVTTQMVKNVLIVPEGAKGGFRLKEVIEDRRERRARADELYKWFIRGLLDVTDNRVGGEVINPPGVVFHDGGDDPYLVVAADKGTAHLSDTANGVAVDEYGFWLADAFASGGSCGYDHKKVGITARGAWQCVERHFQEMGLDPATETYTCVGIGDTGGDVFGNGVIEHPTMRLLGAFNHMHIFLDPDPDTEAAYKERKRLFKAAQGWSGYNRALLSEGGGIFDRTAKSISLTPQVKAMLGTLKNELPPEAVIRLLLRARCDLLWCGGIGTYIKASHETHADADDPNNDRLRINADELRCRAIGEGANLCFTAAARSEFGLRGGRGNTDFVDNSGGVDMSDHEVNLKILLRSAIDHGDLEEGARDKLIRDLTKQVARAVLANNNAHGLQLSLDRVRSQRDPFRFGRAITWMQEQGSPSAQELVLPQHVELERRASDRSGLTRSELATISAHVKMHVYTALKGMDPSCIPDFEDRLLAYFPKRVREAYPDRIRGHMLAKEIAMTTALTEVVANMGATFYPTLIDLTSRNPGVLTGAWITANDAFKLQALRNQLNNSGAPLETRYRAWISVTSGIQGILAAWLRPGHMVPDQSMLERTVVLHQRMQRLRGQEERARFQSARDGLVRKGLGKGLADRAASFADLTVAHEIARCQAHSRDTDRQAVVRYMAVGEASGLLPAIRELESRAAKGKWDAVALGLLRNRYFELLRRVIEATPLDAELKLSVDRVIHKLRWRKLKPVHQTLDSMIGHGAASVSAFLVAEERLNAWLQG